MKKLTALLLAALMLLSFVSCADNADDGNGTDTSAADTNDTADTAEDTNAPETDAPAVELPYKTTLELADLIISKLDPETAPPIGSMEVNMSEEGFDYTLTDLGLPAELHGKIDGATQIRHMMMVNQFSAGVYHFTTAEDAAAAVEAIKNTILAKEWMCGFPEKVAIFTLPDNYVISVYGMGGLDPDPNFAVDYITPFIDAANTVVEGVVVNVNDPIM